jgi:hypothetical protein
MPCKDRGMFDANCEYIDRLLDIHGRLTGDGPGRRYDVEVLNKAGIVLITSFWEAYCEDVAAEGLVHVVKNSKDAKALPKELRKIIAKSLKEDKNEVAIWDLADDGWRSVLTRQLASLQEQRNRKLNTPKSEQIEDLFEKTLGIPKISARWYWNNMTRERAVKKLDRYVVLRGAIAHRGSAASSIKKSDLSDYYSHVKILVNKIDNEVNRYVKDVTGQPVWKDTRFKITKVAAKSRKPN